MGKAEKALWSSSCIRPGTATSGKEANADCRNPLAKSGTCSCAAPAAQKVLDAAEEETAWDAEDDGSPTLGSLIGQG